MPNIRKRRCDRKSEHLNIRMTPAMKERLEQSAKLEGKSVSQFVGQLVEDFLESKDWKRTNTWNLVHAACMILDKWEQKNRKKG